MEQAAPIASQKSTDCGKSSGQAPPPQIYRRRSYRPSSTPCRKGRLQAAAVAVSRSSSPGSPSAQVCNNPAAAMTALCQRCTAREAALQIESPPLRRRSSLLCGIRRAAGPPGLLRHAHWCMCSEQRRSVVKPLWRKWPAAFIMTIILCGGCVSSKFVLCEQMTKVRVLFIFVLCH